MTGFGHLEAVPVLFSQHPMIVKIIVFILHKQLVALTTVELCVYIFIDNVLFMHFYWLCLSTQCS
jgi:hypothetical protein